MVAHRWTFWTFHLSGQPANQTERRNPVALESDQSDVCVHVLGEERCGESPSLSGRGAERLERARASAAVFASGPHSNHDADHTKRDFGDELQTVEHGERGRGQRDYSPLVLREDDCVRPHAKMVYLDDSGSMCRVRTASGWQHATLPRQLAGDWKDL